MDSYDEICSHCKNVNWDKPWDEYQIRNAEPKDEMLVRITPRTMDELKAWADDCKLSFGKLRVCVGEDYTLPKAFGIFKQGRLFTVYKNRADGTRDIRCQTASEQEAVKELFNQILVILNVTNYDQLADARDKANGKKDPLGATAYIAVSIAGFVILFILVVFAMKAVVG